VSLATTQISATLPFPYSSFRDQTSFPPPSAGPSTVALGGTFDHLHAAHKLLLHLSLFLATKKLIVGVMSDSLLSTKSNALFVQPLAERIRGVEEFLSRCQNHSKEVFLDVVEIHDGLGPTAWDPDIDALVVSTETLSGGGMVNDTRRRKGFQELEVFVIDVIASRLDEESEGVRTVDLSGERDEKRLKELKMGSTAIRQWLAEQK
jgi:pantetheine-phosphate adenylyltransferase